MPSVRCGRSRISGPQACDYAAWSFRAIEDLLLTNCAFGLSARPQSCDRTLCFLLHAVAQAMTCWLWQISRTLSLVRSHALILLSMAKLNIARSRVRAESCRRIRMAQISFSFNGGFCPVNFFVLRDTPQCVDRGRFHDVLLSCEANASLRRLTVVAARLRKLRRDTETFPLDLDDGSSYRSKRAIRTSGVRRATGRRARRVRSSLCDEVRVLGRPRRSFGLVNFLTQASFACTKDGRSRATNSR